MLAMIRSTSLYFWQPIVANTSERR